MQQEDRAKAEEEITRLKGVIKAESEARLTSAEQLEALEKNVTELTQENSDLKKELDDHEEHWKKQHANLQKQLDSVTNELTRLKKMVTSMVSSLVGKHPSSKCKIV